MRRESKKWRCMKCGFVIIFGIRREKPYCCQKCYSKELEEVN